MRPLIGIPCYTAKRAGTFNPIHAAGIPYIQAIEEAGGVPVLLPLYEEAESFAALRGRLDGLLLTGGGDVEPVRYGASTSPRTQVPDVARDHAEIELTHRTLPERIPILGICRGLQLLNVACGGTLYQDIPTELPDALNHNLTPKVAGSHQHPIAIQAGSRLAAIVGQTHHEVNSFHHQAVKRAGDAVNVTAWAPDGVVEAIEVADQPFAMAVQFHPERMYTTDAAMRRLFAEFVQACESSRARDTQLVTAVPIAR
jgi:putative glutamine amidotransferase